MKTSLEILRLYPEHDYTLNGAFGLAIAMRRDLQRVVKCDNMAAEVLDDKNNSTGFLDQRRKEGL
jgi:hypothetical protein